MLECLILGDSIAQGVSTYRPECPAYVQQGINSKNFNVKYDNKEFDAGTVIVSLGTNDSPKIDTFMELYNLRFRIKASRVYWILPANDPELYSNVLQVARTFGDQVVKIQNLSPDKVHPTPAGYKNIADQTKTVSGENKSR